MIFTKKEIETIAEDRLLSLKENEIVEDKHLEYKLTLSGNNYKSNKEFLSDISFFANADGCVIFYGINAKDGIPEEIQGLKIDNPDAEILR